MNSLPAPLPHADRAPTCQNPSFSLQKAFLSLKSVAFRLLYFNTRERVLSICNLHEKYLFFCAFCYSIALSPEFTLSRAKNSRRSESVCCLQKLICYRPRSRCRYRAARWSSGLRAGCSRIPRSGTYPRNSMRWIPLPDRRQCLSAPHRWCGYR